ncbi:MAG: prolyl oligopeptidase family serine peptidase [bacterium]|nr:prolyl oligopeptidase family serine peptidase [bacterium]
MGSCRHLTTCKKNLPQAGKQQRYCYSDTILTREGFSKKVFLNYLLYLPKEYGKKKKKHWPLILFLHGVNERGRNLEYLKKNGIPNIVEKRPDFPFITLSPQCARNMTWKDYTDDLIALLGSVTSSFNIDPKRIYITGFSMGGFAAWRLAILHREKFAAAVPICGGGNPKFACRIKQMPLWVFHGGKDPVVPLSRSKDMVSTLKACGSSVRFTVYPNAGHDSWTQTYNNPELYTWLLQQGRR